MRRTIYGIVRNVHTQQMLINGSIRYIKCPKKAKKYNFRMNPYFSCPELRVKVWRGPPKVANREHIFAARLRSFAVHKKRLLGHDVCEKPPYHYGAHFRNRTRDTGIFSPLLYLLS